ncbi:hypothetical protein BGZ97_007495, partial [Linnemannia gamsii]
MSVLKPWTYGPDEPIPPPGECIPHHSDFELALSLFILVGMVVSYLPQSLGPCLESTLGIAQLGVQFVMFGLV